MSGLVGHAREELQRLGLVGPGADDADRLLASVAIMWCENVDRYGLAPDSAAALADMMARLVRLEPLSSEIAADATFPTLRTERERQGARVERFPVPGDVLLPGRLR
jgi:hypothetical protein